MTLREHTDHIPESPILVAGNEFAKVPMLSICGLVSVGVVESTSNHYQLKRENCPIMIDTNQGGSENWNIIWNRFQYAVRNYSRSEQE